ncbi:MAG: DAK2 domain-containing protein [Oscillospiraceae bacterium]|nr:DAK2 domain-containing protein [Oscillospiraceae bacterium]
MIERIDGALFTKAILSAAAAIEAERQQINELNVFPVPDGDTGTNMSLSLGAAATELSHHAHADAGRAVEAASQALLRGARGNSGVILSLLFRGFAKAVKDRASLDGVDLADGLSTGVDVAYRAVMKPAEGTILTVSRVSAALAAKAAEENPAVEFVLTQTLAAAEAALLETVHQNPVLEKAGVVDAGGRGYCVILSGMLAALRGEPFVAVPAVEGQPLRTRADFSEYMAEDIKFDYCTEFIVTRQKKRDVARLRALLEAIGDSLVVVDDEQVIKVHVHTNHPGRALEEALTYGPLSSIKIENMRIQHTEQVIRQSAASPEAAASASAQPESAARVVAPPTRRYGFVTVCAGDGLTRVLRDLGADQVIEGGQTMNPSTEAILQAVDATPAEMVFILPNNKNIILAAEQCLPLSEKELVVIPTTSIPQGIAALLAVDTRAGVSENREAMLAALSGVKSGSVTYAARDSSFDGRRIASGDHMALVDGALLYHHHDRAQVVTHLARAFGDEVPSFVTIFSGEGVDEEEAVQTRTVFEESCPGAEIQLIEGGQPVYYYLVSCE